MLTYTGATQLYLGRQGHLQRKPYTNVSTAGAGPAPARAPLPVASP